jgi:hypothetical protein
MIRPILIIIIIILVVRIFINIGREVTYSQPAKGPEKDTEPKRKGVPKELGEYTEFEEVGKKQ